jgi:UPF0042 nucleotide-binding protein
MSSSEMPGPMTEENPASFRRDARPPPESQEKLVQTVIITGMSGSGKSTALKAFEDMGYFCVDNLPIVLLPEFLSLKEETSTQPRRVALVMDVREEAFLDQYNSIFRQIEHQGYHLEILFLDARDEVLVRRFSQTRRQHPLQPKGTVLEGIRLERHKMAGLKEIAGRLLDTSDLNVHQLRQSIMTLYAPRKRLDRLAIHLISFGFKHGLPAEANLVLDVRFLRNPFFVSGLRPLNGCDPRIRDYVLGDEDTAEFFRLCKDLFRFLVPKYRQEGKSYLVIAVGCTGGRHRSVVMIDYLKEMFKLAGEDVIVTHRDIDKEE